MKAKFLAKNTSDVLEDEIACCQKLIHFIEQEPRIGQLSKITERLNLLKETVEDNLEQLGISQQDASGKQERGLFVFWLQDTFGDDRGAYHHRSHHHNRRNNDGEK